MLLAAATRGSALSKSLGKQAFHREGGSRHPAAYAYASEAMAAASQIEDAREGRAAFRAKRKPVFRDRCSGPR